MLYIFFFSPANTTRKYAAVMGEVFGSFELHDMTLGDAGVTEVAEDDSVLFLAPVYAGASTAFALKNSKRHEPEIFLGQLI